MPPPSMGPGWWVSGGPVLLLVLAYGGGSSLLVGSLGVMLVHTLDLLGGGWAGAALAAWWATLAGLALTVALASHGALMHSFALVLLPAALLAWLVLLGLWGTLQHRWLALEAPALAAFVREVLCGLTPLVAPPLLTWGGLAAGLVEPSAAAFVLGGLVPAHTAAFALPRGPGMSGAEGGGGLARAGLTELRLCVGVGLFLPVAVSAAPASALAASAVSSSPRPRWRLTFQTPLMYLVVLLLLSSPCAIHVPLPRAVPSFCSFAQPHRAPAPTPLGVACRFTWRCTTSSSRAPRAAPSARWRPWSRRGASRGRAPPTHSTT